MIYWEVYKWLRGDMQLLRYRGQKPAGKILWRGLCLSGFIPVLLTGFFLFPVSDARAQVVLDPMQLLAPLAIGDPGAEHTCDESEDPFNNGYTTEPCLDITDSEYIDYPDDWSEAVQESDAMSHQGGWQVIDHLHNLWFDEIKPALQAMTTQIHAGITDQTRQIGSQKDAHNVTKAARQIQQREIDAIKEFTPNGASCEAGEFLGSVPTPGGNAAAGPAGSPNPSAGGPAADQKDRYAKYCAHFYELGDNAGETACPNPTSAGTIPNGDINVEGILFADTIDLGKPTQRAAVTGLMQNLLQPKVKQRIPDDGTNTGGAIPQPKAQERILREEHVESIRKLAAGVVGAIVARRASTPIGDEMVATGGVPADAYGTPITEYISSFGGYDVPWYNGDPNVENAGNFAAYMAAVKQRESGGNYQVINTIGYMGAYQFGEAALVTMGCLVHDGNMNNSVSTYQWTGSPNCGGATSTSAFLNNPAAQDAAMQVYTQGNWNTIVNLGLDAYIGQTVGGILITPSGLLAGSHLLGAGTVQDFLQGGGGGESSIADLLVEIRTKAGVDPSEISANPSYNEIMLAMTKERFFDPEYFVKMKNKLGMLKQEQTVLASYTSIQMQEIHKLQEQINALLAARASLKMDKIPLPNRDEDAPKRN